jgi:2,3-bisphosphoglycerate-dependent phosphoglycerate mutase
VERAILARHGESEASAVDLVNGDPSRPVGLTELGRAQARDLGERLADEPIDLCVVTSFTRTQETANAALAGREIPRLVMSELDDPMAGAFEGRPIAEFRDWFRSNGAATKIPEGESRVESVRRYVTGLRAIAARPEPTILIVAHGLPLTYTLLAARAEQLPLSLEGVQVDHATPYPVGRDELLRAIDGLEAWVGRQGAST